jgi:hypothetical protein
MHDVFHTKMALYSSRDGKQFFRAAGTAGAPWVDNGIPGSQDYGYACHTCAGMMVSAGKMIIPYSAFPHKQRSQRSGPLLPKGSADRHQELLDEITQYGVGNPGYMPQQRGRILQRAIGGLILGEDRWAELIPTYEQGRVYTTQLVFAGNQLRINARCDYGIVRVELLDPEFKPYDKFSAGDCVPVHSRVPDRVWHEVRWKDDPDLRMLWNKPIRLCFHLAEASLYGFQFHNEA